MLSGWRRGSWPAPRRAARPARRAAPLVRRGRYRPRRRAGRPPSCAAPVPGPPRVRQAAHTEMTLAASRLAASAGTLTGYQSSGLSPLAEQAACARRISQSVRSVMAKPLVITVDRSMPPVSRRHGPTGIGKQTEWRAARTSHQSFLGEPESPPPSRSDNHDFPNEPWHLLLAKHCLTPQEGPVGGAGRSGPPRPRRARRSRRCRPARCRGSRSAGLPGRRSRRAR
jgi:hypothetical protein